MIGSAGVVVVVLIFSFISYRHQQGEIAAGQAVTQVMVSQTSATAPAQFASALLKVAADYPGTAAAARAQLQGASVLFESGQYAEAQTEFQKFLNANPDSPFKAMATYGVAASLEAQGQNTAALTLYQQVADQSDPTTLLAAKFAVGRLSEEAGHLNEALADYEDVARAAGNAQLGAEAGIRAMEIQTKIGTNAPAFPTATLKE